MQKWICDSVHVEAAKLMLEGRQPGPGFPLWLFAAMERNRPDVIAHLKRYRPNVDPYQIVKTCLTTAPGLNEDPQRILLGPMKAWLLTWRDQTPKGERVERIAAILNAAHSPKSVAELLQLLYAQRMFDVLQLAAYAANPALSPHTPRQDGAALVCGYEPLLRAVPVYELIVKLDAETRRHTVSWVEAGVSWTHTVSSGG